MPNFRLTLHIKCKTDEHGHTTTRLLRELPLTARRAPAPALLQEAPLRALIAANVVQELTAIGRAGGFVLRVELADRTAFLASTRGEQRIFASLSTLACLMKRLGAPRFAVDAAEFGPGRLRRPQPERSAAMKEGRLPRASDASTAPAKQSKK